MAISKSLSEKSTRQYTSSIIVYFLIFLIISMFLIFRDRNIIKEEENTNISKSKICYVGEVQENIKVSVNEYIKGKNYEISSTNCNVTLARNISDVNEYNRVLSNTYVFVKSYDSYIVNIPNDELIDILNTQKYKEYSILWDINTDKFLRSRFSIGVGQAVYSKDELKKKISNNINTIGIVPINEMSAKYSIVDIDFQSPYDEEYNINKYPLLDSYWINGDKKDTEPLSKYINESTISININKDNLKTLVLTGSSAIGAGELYSTISTKGVEYLFGGISTVLQIADLVQLNNEISYTTNCVQTGISSRLCGKNNAISKEVFSKLNIKAVGINGNHILDQTVDSFKETISTYNNYEISSYGGGLNIDQARTGRTVKDTNISFLGYSYIYPFSYGAKENTPGNSTAVIDDIKRDIDSLPKDNIKIIDMSWGYEEKSELVDYQLTYTEQLKSTDFDILIGTNSLKPQKLVVEDERIIAYNLGSFLPYNTKYIKEIGGVMIKVYIYDKKIVSTELIYIIMDKNNQLQLADDSQKDTIREYIK